MLEQSHNLWLVAASFAVALFAGFSGLTLVDGASEVPTARRKVLVAFAAVVLGGGIWSMHFVAMLGLELPVPYFYNGLTTLISALIAILMVGAALLLLHFARRTGLRMVIAGCLIGVGITTMHFIGMSGMELCGPVYTVQGVLVALISSLGFSVVAVWLAYGTRGRSSILLGTVGFAGAVVSTHFIAMAGTRFLTLAETTLIGLSLSNATLAAIVVLASFLLSGAALLSGVTFLEVAPMATPQATALAEPKENLKPKPDLAEVAPKRIPFEKNGGTHFVDLSDIAAIRAEGHYTIIYTGAEKLFCPWSISEAASRLRGSPFMRTHRSYLLNPAFVQEFRRTKDTGLCLLKGSASLSKVPVSRSCLGAVRKSLNV